MFQLKIQWHLLRGRLFIKHPTGLRWDQLHNRLLCNLMRATWSGKKINIKGMTIGTWRTNGNELGIGLHHAELPLRHLLWGFGSIFRMWMIWTQQLGNGLIDKRAHGFRSGTQSKECFGKKLAPDVRDDPMEGPPYESESLGWGTISWKSTVESWVA